MSDETQEAFDERIEALLDADDNIGALCALVKRAGLTMTLHGVPVDEVQLRAGVEQSVVDRLDAAIRALPATEESKP